MELNSSKRWRIVDRCQVSPNPCLSALSRPEVAYTGLVPEDETACLARLAEEWKFPLTPEMSERVLGFCRLLLKWNASVNLTGARSVSEVIGEHIVDSFAMVQLVFPRASVVDVGSGGGLPGLPFAIARPDARLTLVEPRAKRVAFLRTAVRELQLTSTEVLRERAGGLDQGAFDVAASRATFPPEEWLGLGLGLVRPKGVVLVFAGQAWRPDRSPLRPASELCYLTAGGRRRWIGAFCST